MIALTTRIAREIIASYGCELIGEYNGYSEDVRIKCVCGSVRDVKYNNFINSDNHLCNVCGRRAEKTKTIERFLRIGLSIIDESSIKGVHNKIDVVDSEGYKYFTVLSSAENCFPKRFHFLNPFFLDNMKLWTILENKSFDISDYFRDENNSLRVISNCHVCNQKWDADWQSIYSLGTGCPWCVNRRVTKENSFVYLYPELMNDWDWDNNMTIDPYSLAPNSHERIYWKCHICQHCWDCVLSNRTSLGRGCPGCAKKVATSYNNFAIRFPELLCEWDYDANGDPHQYSPFSGKNVSWICFFCGRKWPAAINSRTSNGSDCPSCSSSSNEKTAKRFFVKNNIDFEEQYRIKQCRKERELPFDFAIFEDNFLFCLLELQGPQHYMSFSHFGGEEKFIEQQENDAIKFEYCQNNNIPLLIIPYWEFKNIDLILSSYLNL